MHVLLWLIHVMQRKWLIFLDRLRHPCKFPRFSIGINSCQIDLRQLYCHEQASTSVVSCIHVLVSTNAMAIARKSNFKTQKSHFLPKSMGKSVSERSATLRNALHQLKTEQNTGTLYFCLEHTKKVRRSPQKILPYTQKYLQQLIDSEWTNEHFHSVWLCVLLECPMCPRKCSVEKNACFAVKRIKKAKFPAPPVLGGLQE